MKQKELLAPVGSFEALYQAIHNGCDAVYLSGKNFGARKFAPNFDHDELVQAIKYCHLYGVKIYITVNTLVHDVEKEELLEYISFLHTNNVDAVIMQDLGMIYAVREKFPKLEIHASTQLHNHNKSDLNLLKKLGITRAVLARELTLEEIKKLGTEMELEVFIHGALCISYSGQCLFSSLVMNRSGNRGECAGLCRLPYQLLKENQTLPTKGEYILSPKELNTSLHLFKLLDLENVSSVKIEGRMKSPEYVGFITAFYREILDAYQENREVIITEEQQENLHLLYNREFTKGHLFHDTKKDLMNELSPNHIGIELGELTEVTPKKVFIRLKRPLTQGDGIRFENNEGMIANFIYNRKDMLVSSVLPGDTISLDNKLNIEKLGSVRKTRDENLMKSLALREKRKIKIKGFCKANKEEVLSLKLTDGRNEVVVYSSIVEEAKNSPTTKERIIEQLLKIKDTPFEFEELKVETNNAFIIVKDLNELRRSAIVKLIELRENSISNKEQFEISRIELANNKNRELELSVLVRTKEQLETSLLLNVNRIYITNRDLYEEYKENEKVYYRTPRVEMIQKKYTGEKLLIGEIGGLFSYKEDNTIITDYFCNAYNSNTVALFQYNNAKTVTLSVELKVEDIIELMNSFKKEYKLLPSVEVIVYGRLELMVMKHCIVATQISKTPCNLCRENINYYLKDRNKERYPIINDCPNTHIFNYKRENKLKYIDSLINAGITSYRLEFFDESIEEVQELIEYVKNSLKLMP